MTGRNEKCPCGSGKKYKYCCMQKDIETQKFEPKKGEPHYEENMPPKFPTWKIFLIAAAALAVIALIFYFAISTRIAGTIFGCGMLILIVYTAFRNVPSVRKNPGDAGNIDFGNRS